MQGLIGVLRGYLKHAAILLAIGLSLQFASAHSPGQAGAQSGHWRTPLQTPLRDAPKRPRITGIDHVRLYVTEVANAQPFYSKFLPSEGGGCTETRSACFPVNPHQQIELQGVTTPAPQNWLAEIGFATDDVEQMRRYLVASGIDVGPMSTKPHAAKHFELRDPEGNRVAFIQRPPTAVNYISSDAQIGNQLFHAGFVVKDREAENRFYRDVLGFRLYWYGGFKDDGVDWYEIQVPDGSDWIEYMLNIPANADHKELGIQNHFSLGVKDIHAAAEQLHKNGLAKFDGPEIGRDGKWGLDAYDPDGTRVEFMEFTPAGKPCCHPYSAPHPQL